MDFEKFLSNKAPDFLGRMLKEIWNFSDNEIERNHDFIQLLFPTDKESRAVTHGFFLGNEMIIQKLRNNEEVKKNLVISAEWFLNFLRRQSRWRRPNDHNHLRITRVIESLRLLVSDQQADLFRDTVLSMLSDDAHISDRTLRFWQRA